MGQKQKKKAKEKQQQNQDPAAQHAEQEAAAGDGNPCDGGFQNNQETPEYSKQNSDGNVQKDEDDSDYSLLDASSADEENVSTEGPLFGNSAPSNPVKHSSTSTDQNFGGGDADNFKNGVEKMEEDLTGEKESEKLDVDIKDANVSASGTELENISSQTPKKNDNGAPVESSTGGQSEREKEVSKFSMSYAGIVKHLIDKQKAVSTAKTDDNHISGYHRVHFSVLLSPDYKFKEDSDALVILFGHSALGGFATWDSWQHRLNLVVRQEKYLLFAATIRIPRHIQYTQYKYAVVRNATPKVDEGLIEVLYKQGGYANRELEFTDNKEEIYFQMDACCHPNYAKEGTIKHWKRAVLGDNAKEEFATAWNLMLPRWDRRTGFFLEYDINSLASSSPDTPSHLDYVDSVNIASSTVRKFSSRYQQLFDFSDANRRICKMTADYINIGVAKVISVDNLPLEQRLSAAAYYLFVAHEVSNFFSFPVNFQPVLELLAQSFVVPETCQPQQITGWVARLRAKTMDNHVLHMFGWLASHLQFNPVVLPVLLLSCYIDSEFASSQSLAFQDNNWWLPSKIRETLYATSEYNHMGLPRRRVRFAHAQSAVVSQMRQNVHYFAINEKFITLVLDVYFTHPADITEILEIVPPHCLGYILAWCARWWRQQDGSRRSYFKEDKDIFEFEKLLPRLTEIINSSPDRIWCSLESSVVFDVLSTLLRTACSVWDWPDTRMVLLRSLIQLSSAIEPIIEDKRKDQLANVLREFLVQSRFSVLIPTKQHNYPTRNAPEENKRFKEIYKPCYTLQLGGKMTNDAWNSLLDAVLKQWHQTGVGQRGLIGLYCQPTLDENQRKRLQPVVLSAAESLFTGENAEKNFDDAMKQCNLDGFGQLLSILLQQKWLVKAVHGSDPVEIFSCLLESPILVKYFDENVLQILTAYCRGLMGRATESVHVIWQQCLNGQWNLQYVRRLLDHRAAFIELIQRVCGSNSTPGAVLQNFQDVSNAFGRYIDELKILKMFLKPEENFDNVSDLFAVLRRDVNNFHVSEICNKSEDEAHHFHCRYTLPADVSRMVDRLRVLADNCVFGYFWKKAVEGVEIENIPVALEKVPDSIMRKATEETKMFLHSISDMSLPLKNLDAFITSLNLSTTLNWDALFNSLKDCHSKIDKHLPSIKTGSDRIRQYLELKRSNNVCQSFQDFCKKLKADNAMAELEKIYALQGDQETKQLRDVTPELSKCSTDLAKLEYVHTNFIDAIVESWSVIEWAKKFKDDQEFQTFIEILSSNIGDNDFSVAIVMSASKFLSACQMFAFSNEPYTQSLGELLLMLQPMWEALKLDNTLPDKARSTATNLPKLDELKASVSDVEKSSINEARKILEIGVLSVGNFKNEKVINDAEECLKIIVPATDTGEKKEYDAVTLRDLHSRLMLIGAQMEKNETTKKDIEMFANIYEKLLCLAKLFKHHYDSGNVLLSNMRCCFYMSRNQRRAEAFISQSHLRTETGEHIDVLQQITSLCEILESALDEWKKYVLEIREKFPVLNLFTNRQMEFLRRQLANICREFNSEASALLMSVKIDVSQADVLHAVRAFADTEEVSSNEGSISENQEDDEQIQFLKTLHAYMSPTIAKKAAQAVNYSDPYEAVQWYSDNKDQMDTEEEDAGPILSNSMPQSASCSERISALIDVVDSDNNSLAMKIEAVWKQHILNHENSSFVEFLGLRHLGYALDILQKESQSPAVSILGFDQQKLKTNEPNLLLSKESEIYRFFISVYAYLTNGRWARFDEILVCKPTTTKEEVQLFMERVQQNSFDNIYSIMDVQFLNADASDMLETRIDSLMQNCGGNALHLLIFGCQENFERSCAGNSLLPFLRKFNDPENWSEMRRFLVEKTVRHGKKFDGNFSTMAAEKMGAFFKANLVTTVGYGHGKTLCVRRQFDHLKISDRSWTYVKIPLHDRAICLDLVYDMLDNARKSLDGKSRRFFHLDIFSHQTRGVDALLFQLFAVGGFTTSSGKVWRVLDGDVYAIEIASAPNQFLCKESKKDASLGHEFRFLLPVVFCRNPISALDNAKNNLSNNQEVVSQFCVSSWLKSEPVQRVYYYLSNAANPNLVETFSDNIKRVLEEGVVLEMLWKNCGIADPSWSELQHFVSFLNEQLRACEASIYCSEYLADDLPGFRKFVINFMVRMSRDFATRSLDIAEDVSSLPQERFDQFNAYEMKERWEHRVHPYLFFNEDGETISFFGCNFDRQGYLTDMQTGQRIPNQQQPMVSEYLYNGLRTNGVSDMSENFDNKMCATCRQNRQRNCVMCRREKLQKLCRVLGVSEQYDPDPNYEITADCVMKMMAIKMRLRCKIPVVIMGETGCGKTKLIEYLCALERGGRANFENLIIFRVHGGVTKIHISEMVENALRLAENNWRDFKMPTYLFFDEANTTSDVNFIKEIICDRSLNGDGSRLSSEDCHLHMIAALNPCRKHSDKLLERFEKMGLGYHVTANTSNEMFGDIPVRQLAYRVQPLPPSLIPLVWDFGKLSLEAERCYIRQMVERFLNHLPRGQGTILAGEAEILSDMLSAVQQWMAKQEDETSFVSLRNVERTLTVAEWFLRHSDMIFSKMNTPEKTKVSDICRATILAVCVCYRASVQMKRHDFDAHLKRQSAVGNIDLKRLIEACQDVILDSVKIDDNVAKNSALKENLFMMTLAIELRIPLFLIGRPGSSKTLSKTIIAEKMRGPNSLSAFYKNVKQATMLSFQCSPLATADGIEGVFRQAARLQKDLNLDTHVAVVVFDELGLAEGTLALKALHGLLEEGCRIENEKLEKYHKVAFVGISNWALDPAKMNRGIFVTRPVLKKKELITTARHICHENTSIYNYVSNLIEPLVDAYLKVYEHKDNVKDFFGLRDFYCLMKMVYDIASSNNRRPKFDEIIRAVARNFSGRKDCPAIHVFSTDLHSIIEYQEIRPVQASVLLQENLQGLPNKERENRYLLVLTENYAALRLTSKLEVLKNALTIFGSGFPRDLEYTQVCRNINKIKVCMDKGRPVILLNLESLYESLYDLLNQSFLSYGGEKYVDLGLGTHRLKCHVHKEFRLVVVAEYNEAMNFPAALINRLEKHFVALKSELTDAQHTIVEQLKKWVEKFTQFQDNTCFESVSPEDVFIGYNCDTLAGLVVETMFGNENPSEEDIIKQVQYLLLQCATPEAIIRLPMTALVGEAEEIQSVYFSQQPHKSLLDYMHMLSGTEVRGRLTQITTHSSLLASQDRQRISREIGIAHDRIHMLKLWRFGAEHEFVTALERIYKASDEDQQMHYAIIQCAYEESNAKLLACCRFHLENFEKREDYENTHVRVFLIVQLPRKKGGCFIGFQTGVWQCFHIDELIQNADEIVNAADLMFLRQKSIADLFEDFVENRSTPNFNFRAVISDAILLAASSIDDYSPRKLERNSILLKLWKENQTFSRILCQHLKSLLKDEERHWQNAQDWMLKETVNTKSIFENRTYAQSVRKRIEQTIVPLLAGLISRLDRGDNLNLLCESTRSEITSLWLQLFDDRSFFDVHYESPLYLETDEDGMRRRRNVFRIKSCAKPFETPFFSVIAKKIHHVINSEPNDNLLEIENRVLILLKNVPWFSSLLSANNSVLRGLLADIIHQKYTDADEKLSLNLMQWLQDSMQLFGYTTNVVGAFLAHDALSVRMRLAVNIFSSARDVLDISGMRSEDLDLISRLNFQMDLFAAKAIYNYLAGRISKLDDAKLFSQAKEERSRWSALVARISPYVKQVLSKQDPRIGTVRELKESWFGVEFTHSFLTHLEKADYLCNVKGIWDFANFKGNQNVADVTFWKHLDPVLKLMNSGMFKHYFKCKEMTCTQCQLQLNAVPVILPCLHVMHERCFKHMTETMDHHFCTAPRCKKAIPPNFQREAETELKNKTAKYQSTRSAVMNFFMDIVYGAFATKDDAIPSAETMDYLLKYATFVDTEQRNRTRLFSLLPDDEAIDHSPVLRSFLLQLICAYDISKVLPHIENYLNNARQYFANENENGTNLTLIEFMWMCITIIEDSFHARFAEIKLFEAQRATVDGYLHELTNELSARNFDIQNADAESLYHIAKARFVLSSFADFIYKLSTKQFEDRRPWRVMVNNIKSLAEKFPQIRLLLIRYLGLKYGRDLIKFCTESEAHLQWIVDKNILSADGTHDSFVIYGDSYANVKASLQESLFQRDAAVFKTENLDPRLELFFLNCTIATLPPSPEQATVFARIFDEKTQGVDRTAAFLAGKFRDATFRQRLTDAVTGDQRQADLIWHVMNILGVLPHADIAEFFQNLLFDPQSCRGLLFPTMADDLASYRGIDGAKFYLCPNGHPYLIGDCTRATTTRTCIDCGQLVGGTNHALLANNSEATNVTELQYGHCLGAAAKASSQLGEREMTRNDAVLLRCLMHATMLGSALLHGEQAISQLITPAVSNGNVLQFLRDHLTQNIATLSRAFSCSNDDACLFVHQLLRLWLEKTDANTNILLLQSKEGRVIWERRFCDHLSKYVSQHAKELILRSHNDLVRYKGADKFWQKIYQQDDDEPTARVWFYRVPVELDGLKEQTLTCLNSCDEQQQKRLQILRTFLEKMPYLGALRFLIPIRELHRQLSNHFHGCVSMGTIEKTTIEEFLQRLPDETARLFEPLIDAFFEAVKIVVAAPMVKKVYLEQGISDKPRSLPLSILLPMNTNSGSCCRELLNVLTGLQNDLLDVAVREVENSENRVKYVDYNMLTPLQIINFDYQRDGLKLLMLHRTLAYSLGDVNAKNLDANNTGGRTSLHFDLEMMQHRIRRFILASAVHILPMFPLIRAKEALLLECLNRLRKNETVELSTTQRRDVLDTLRKSLPDTKEFLNNLEIMIRFSTSLNESDMKTLSLADFLKQVRPGVNNVLFKSYNVCHLVALWQLASYQVKCLLISKNVQDPFSELDNGFKESMPADLATKFCATLKNVNTLQFVLEATEFLALHLQPSSGSVIACRLHSKTIFDEPLHTYLLERENCTVANDYALPDAVLVKHVVDVWTLCAGKAGSISEKRCFSVFLRAVNIEILHTAVDVYGVEYAYGKHQKSTSGIYPSKPREDDLLPDSFSFKESMLIGYTTLSKGEIKKVIEKLSRSFTGKKYDLLSYNCNTFSAAFCEELCGMQLPDHVDKASKIASRIPFISKYLSR